MGGREICISSTSAGGHFANWGLITVQGPPGGWSPIFGLFLNCQKCSLKFFVTLKSAFTEEKCSQKRRLKVLGGDHCKGHQGLVPDVLFSGNCA